jgi:DNA-binding MarR family transcriptional regulator
MVGMAVDGETAAVRRAVPSLLHDQRIADMGLLIDAHARLTRVLGAQLERRTGIPLTWLDVLIRLGGAPDHHMTMTELARRVALTSGGTTRLVDRIAEAGLVERINCPSDRRSIYVSLTPLGRRKLDEALAVHLEGLQQHLVDPLDEDDRRSLRDVLRKLAVAGAGCGTAELDG